MPRAIILVEDQDPDIFRRTLAAINEVCTGLAAPNSLDLRVYLANTHNLTPGELDVVLYRFEHKNQSVLTIARTIDLSEYTVRTYLCRVYKKMNVTKWSDVETLLTRYTKPQQALYAA